MNLKPTALLLLLILLNTAYAEKILWLSDIHFNPYSQCPASGITPCPKLLELIQSPIESWPAIIGHEEINSYKQETGNTLLINGLNQMTKLIPESSTREIFVTGDILSHGFDSNFKRLVPPAYNRQEELSAFSSKTIIYVLSQIHMRYPKSKIYLALGNNDNDDGDYNVPTPAFLSPLANYLAKYTDDKLKFITSYTSGGYFSTKIGKKITLIGLNSDVLSKTMPSNELALSQLSWLEKQLAKAQQEQQKVIFIQHIPFGLDLYKSAKGNTPELVLNQDLQDKYLKLLQKYAANITAIYAGHYHTEFMSVINHKTPQIGCLAFNALFGNNPGFKQLNLDDSGNFAGFTTYFAQLESAEFTWHKLYSYQEVYGNPRQIASRLDNFPRQLAAAETQGYRKYFNGNSKGFPQPISQDSKWLYYYCGIKYVQLKDYTTCLTQNN